MVLISPTDIDLTIPVLVIAIIIVGIIVGLFCYGVLAIIVSAFTGNTETRLNGSFAIAYAIGIALFLWIIYKLLSAGTGCGGNIPCGPAMPPPAPPPPLNPLH